jgi:radical SAM protein (TIGR01212 family)
MGSYADYCRRLFGRPMLKLTIDGGFSCPNRDGTLGTEGCSYCCGEAFSPAYCRGGKSITQQIDEGIRFHASRRCSATGDLAYFQSYSNTYAPLDILRMRYEEALAHPLVSGLVIGTRPDCVDEEKLDYLASLSKQHYVMVEYGIESCYDHTLASIGRGHDYACTCHAIQATARRGIACGGHLILGLPGENLQEMVEEASLLSLLPLTTLKLHQLQVLKGSQMGRQYLCHPGSLPPPFQLEQYITLVCDFLERLRPDIMIERFAASVPPSLLADPARSWRHPDGSHVKGSELSRLIRAELARRGTSQGFLHINK